MDKGAARGDVERKRLLNKKLMDAMECRREERGRWTSRDDTVLFFWMRSGTMEV
jgi:hypothetical protein